MDTPPDRLLRLDMKSAHVKARTEIMTNNEAQFMCLGHNPAPHRQHLRHSCQAG